MLSYVQLKCLRSFRSCFESQSLNVVLNQVKISIIIKGSNSYIKYSYLHDMNSQCRFHEIFIEGGFLISKNCDMIKKTISFDNTYPVK